MRHWTIFALYKCIKFIFWELNFIMLINYMLVLMWHMSSLMNSLSTFIWARPKITLLSAIQVTMFKCVLFILKCPYKDKDMVKERWNHTLITEKSECVKVLYISNAYIFKRQKKSFQSSHTVRSSIINL